MFFTIPLIFLPFLYRNPRKRHLFSHNRHHNTSTMNFSSKSAMEPKKIFSFETFSMSIDQGKQSSIFQGGVKFSFCNFFWIFYALSSHFSREKNLFHLPCRFGWFLKIFIFEITTDHWKKRQKIRRNSRTAYPSSILRPFLESTENFQPNRVE